MRTIRSSRLYNSFIIAAIAMFAVALLTTTVRATEPADPAQRYEPLLKAIRTVESSNNANVKNHNDAGTVAIGAYQIHEAYWRDSNTPGKWTDCHDATYSRTVVINYWKRYCPDALSNGNLRALAMTHHGGPNGSRDNAYWNKIVTALSDQDSPHVASIFDF